jgi:exopolysaccharide production protein ExoZ
MKLTNIQILRAIAALAVVFYHITVESAGVCKANGVTCEGNYWFGNYGVNLFFMISGFIMVVTSWKTFGQPGAVRAFLDKRLKRIVPLYWLVTTVGVVGVFFVPSMLSVSVLDPVYVVASYLFWPMERLNGLVRPIATLGWTLNLEMFFYVVFATALFFGRLRGLLGAVVFLVALTLLHATGLFAKTGSLALVPLNFWADPIILNFVFGIGVGVLYMQGQRTSKIQNVTLAGAAGALLLSVELITPWLLQYEESHLIYRLATALPMLPIMLLGGLGPQIDVSKLWSRVAMFLGDASYSLYLVHPFALRPFRAIWIKVIGADAPLWIFAIACLGISLFIGVACYMIAERPFANYFGRRKIASANALKTPNADNDSLLLFTWSTAIPGSARKAFTVASTSSPKLNLYATTPKLLAQAVKSGLTRLVPDTRPGNSRS